LKTNCKTERKLLYYVQREVTMSTETLHVGELLEHSALKGSTQRALQSVGVMLGEKEHLYLSRNKNLDKTIWKTLVERRPRENVALNLSGRKLSQKQRQLLFKTERRAKVLANTIRNNTLTQTEIEFLFKLNKREVTLALLETRSWEIAGQGLCREAIELLDDSKATHLYMKAKMLAKINAFDAINNQSREGNKQENITKALHLLEKLLKNTSLGNLRKTLAVAELVSSNLKLNQTFSSNLTNLTVDQQLCAAESLSRTPLGKETGKQLAKLLNNQPKTANSTTNQILNTLRSNLTVEAGTTHLKLYRLVAQVQRKTDAKMPVKPEQLYTALNIEDLLKILQIKNRTETKWGVTTAGNTGLDLLLNEQRRHVERNHKTVLETEQVNLIERLNDPCNLAGIYYGNRNAKNLKKQRINKLLNRAEKTLGNNPVGWQYWLGLNWNTLEEAERNICIAAKLVETEN